MAFEKLSNLNLRLGNELLLEFYNGIKIKTTMVGNYINLQGMKLLLFTWNKKDNGIVPFGYQGQEWKFFSIVPHSAYNIHPDKEKFGEVFGWISDTDRSILGEKLSSLSSQDTISVPAQIIKLPDFPCRQCKRPNNETEKNCWWCSTENPVAKPLRCQRCNFSNETVRKVNVPFIGEMIRCTHCHP